MKFVCSVLMVFIPLSASFHRYYVGDTKDNSQELVRKTDGWFFESIKCRVIQFNTCREYDVIIEKIQVDTKSGNDVKGKLLYGGVEDFYFALQLCGDGLSTYETTIWGHVRDPKTSTEWSMKPTIDVTRTFSAFDQWRPCDHSLFLY